jgi:hypothetical protein
MRFVPVPPSGAAGGILAPSAAVEGRIIRKGAALTPADTAALVAAGIG